MRFIFEEQQPGFLFPVRFHFNLHRAGIDLFALIQLRKHAPGLQRTNGHRRQIHQADGRFPAEFPPNRQIILIRLFQQGIRKFDPVNLRQESGMAAMIAPVCIQHPDLRDGRIPFFIPEVLLTEGDVIRIHGQAIIRDKLFQACPIQIAEGFQVRHIRRTRIFGFQGCRLFEGGFPGFHRIDDIFPDLGDFRLRQIPVEGIELCTADQGTFSLADDLNTLGRRIGPLVKLTRQVFDGKDVGAGKVRLRRRDVQLRLGENRPDRFIEEVFGNEFRIVAIQESDFLEARDVQEGFGVGFKRTGFVVQARFFFNVDSVNHLYFSLSVGRSAIKRGE